MSVDLFERYKDALPRGHMAVARGQLDDALAAYREALALAPDRMLPHASIGQILLRQAAFRDALAAFDAALTRSPRDETGLRGRADALAKLGRRTDAAESLDVLSGVQEAAGRVADASDTTRLALDLAEQKARRRRLTDLTRRLRLASGEQPTEGSLATTLRTLDAPDRTGADPEAPVLTEASATEDTAEAAAEAAAAAEDEPEPELEAPEPEPAPDPLVLVAQAEAAIDTGDLPAALAAYLAAATAFEADGLFVAALHA